MIDVLVIGGGPGGLTAGMYVARSGFSVRLCEGYFIGGQIVNTALVENIPGFPDGIDGPDFALRMEQQASKSGVEISYDAVAKVELAGEVKRATLASGEVIEARAVIIATGANPRKLGVAREDELLGRGISYCATCDGAFFKGKIAIVAGGGDTAVSDAIYLARICSHVYLVHRRDELRAKGILVESMLAEPNVEVVWDSVITGLVGDQRLTGIWVQNVKTQLIKEIDADALFIAVGTTPNSAFLDGQLELTDGGQIVTDGRMCTNVPGVYAIGDVRNTTLRQVVTASADGAIAASEVDEYLSIKR